MDFGRSAISRYTIKTETPVHVHFRMKIIFMSVAMVPLEGFCFV